LGRTTTDPLAHRRRDKRKKKGWKKKPGRSQETGVMQKRAESYYGDTSKKKYPKKPGGKEGKNGERVKKRPDLGANDRQSKKNT